MNDNNQQVVLVTGAATGIGRVTAETLARDGHRVFASMRDPEVRNRQPRLDFEALADDENLALSVLELDVSDTDSVERAVTQVIGLAERVDVLVNNAGIMHVGITEGYTDLQVHQAFDVNVFGLARTIRAVLPHMRRQRSGLLVQVTSLAGRLVFPHFGVYCATKFAAEALAENYHYELAQLGVDSVIVEPGPFPSKLISKSAGPDDVDRLDDYGRAAERPAAMLASFDELFATDDAPDPTEVATAIAGLIEMPAGERPLRTVAGLDYGVRAFNKAVSPIQRDLLAAPGFDESEVEAESAA